MEGFVEAVALGRSFSLVQAITQHIRMPFFPRRIGDLGDNGFDTGIGHIETVVEADRVEAVAEGAQVSEKANRSARSGAGLAFHQIAHCLVEWHLRIAEVVGAPQPA